jgi:hypothetical protein
MAGGITLPAAYECQIWIFEALMYVGVQLVHLHVPCRTAGNITQSCSHTCIIAVTTASDLSINPVLLHPFNTSQQQHHAHHSAVMVEVHCTDQTLYSPL